VREDGAADDLKQTHFRMKMRVLSRWLEFYTPGYPTPSLTAGFDSAISAPFPLNPNRSIHVPFRSLEDEVSKSGPFFMQGV